MKKKETPKKKAAVKKQDVTKPVEAEKNDKLTPYCRMMLDTFFDLQSIKEGLTFRSIMKAMEEFSKRNLSLLHAKRALLLGVEQNLLIQVSGKGLTGRCKKSKQAKQDIIKARKAE